MRGLSYGYKHSSFHHGITFADENGSDSARSLSFDVVLHLHCFEHDNRVSDGNSIANLDRDFCDGTRERCYDLCTTTCLNWSWCRFWSRSRAYDWCGCWFLHLYFLYLLAYGDRLLEFYIEINSVYVDLCECSLYLIDFYIVVNTLYCILIFAIVKC